VNVYLTGGQASVAKATLQVKTSGTKPVTIYVRFAGSPTAGGSGTGAMTYQKTLSGKTLYTNVVVPATGGYPLPGACRLVATYYIVVKVTTSPAGPTAQDSIDCSA